MLICNSKFTYTNLIGAILAPIVLVVILAIGCAQQTEVGTSKNENKTEQKAGRDAKNTVVNNYNTFTGPTMLMIFGVQVAATVAGQLILYGGLKGGRSIHTRIRNRKNNKRLPDTEGQCNCRHDHME